MARRPGVGREPIETILPERPERPEPLAPRRDTPPRRISFTALRRNLWRVLEEVARGEAYIVTYRREAVCALVSLRDLERVRALR